MKKMSNALIIGGIILTIIICIFKFVNLHFDGISNIESKYLLWSLVPIGVIILIVIGKSKNTSSNHVSSWFGGIVGFVGAIVKIVAFIALILAILGGLYYGGIWTKKSIDSWVRQDNSSSNQELVVVRPGLYTIIDVNKLIDGKYTPPVPTSVEYLDQYGQPIPVECNGLMVYRIISRPNSDNNVVSDQNLRFLRLSSADPDSGEYSFVIKIR